MANTRLATTTAPGNGKGAPIGAPLPTCGTRTSLWRCEGTTLVLSDATSTTVRRWRCRQWKCQICRPRLKRRLRALAYAGQPTAFLTLTSRYDPARDPREAARDILRAWQYIRREIRRHWPAPRLEYLATWERTTRGWPHLHVLLRGPFIPQRWLSSRMNSLTGSPIVDIRRVANQDIAAAYVAKYVGKDPQPLASRQRYTRSHNWPVLNADSWRRYPLDPSTWWCMLTLHPEQVADKLRAMGYIEGEHADPDVFRFEALGDWLEHLAHPPPSAWPYRAKGHSCWWKRRYEGRETLPQPESEGESRPA